MKTENLPERTFEYPYDDAITNIESWAAYVGDLEVPHAYFLHKDDILFLLDELARMGDAGMGVRCYPARRLDNGENHLLMVAVEANGLDGKDIYNTNGPSRIFDLTRPCPRMCDVQSALYLASVNKKQLPLSTLRPAHKTD